MKKVLAVFAALVMMLVFLPASVGNAATPVTSTQTLASGRSYIFHRLAETQNQPMPLVIMLHGYAQTATNARSYTNLEAVSDIEGYNVIFGQGTAGRWNAGECCGNATTDDVQYLKDVVDDISAKTLVDRQRVYIWGFSNGGMMAIRAQCEAPGYFTAVGNMGGTLTSPSQCAGKNLTVRHLHGTLDTTVPLRGGFNSTLNYTFRDSLTNANVIGPESNYTLSVAPGCAHEWASLSACNFSANGAFWGWMKNKRLP